MAVGDPPPPDTDATAFVRTPGEVAELLELSYALEVPGLKAERHLAVLRKT